MHTHLSPPGQYSVLGHHGAAMAHHPLATLAYHLHGLAGQGKLGIPNGIMGLYEAGGTLEFGGKPIPLNSPRKCLDASLAFVSEDRRGVGLLLDESLEWNVAFPAMQIHDKFLKKHL